MDRAIIKRKINSSDMLKKIGVFIYSFVVGLCELKSGVYPFSICLLCAHEKYLFQIFLGCVVSGVLVVDGNYLQIAVAMIIFGIKWLCLRKKGDVVFGVKLTLTVLSAAFIAFGEFLSGNLIFEGAMRSIMVFVSLPLITLAICAYTKKETRLGKYSREISILMYVFITIKSVAIFDVGFFSFSIVVASYLTLYFSRNGFAFGGVCGFVCGMSLGVAYMPILGIMGLSFGIFYENNKIFAAVFSYLLSCSVGSYLLGIENSSLGIINILIGVILFVLTHNKLPSPVFCRVGMVADNSMVLAKLGSAFSSLSQVFYTVSDVTAKSTKNELSDKIKANVFALCNKCGECECDKFDIVNCMSDAINKKGMAVFDDLPKHIYGSCKKGGELLFAANSAVENSDNAYRNGIKSMADEYLAFSKLISSAKTKNEGENFVSIQRNRRVRELLHDKGITCRSVTVYGKRKLRIIVSGVVPEKIKLSPKELSYMLSTLLTQKITEPEILVTDNGYDMKFVSRPMIQTECAKAVITKAGETVCGDTVSFFENDDNYFYSLISDGMGSGRDAELASRLAAIFIEKLLCVGAEPNEVLEMLNKLLIVKEEEIFATVDLLEIDRTNGEARLIKAGAAPTFLYRGNDCFRLEAQTPPIGIMSEIKAAQTKMKLKRGDFVVMVSDGLIPNSIKPEFPQKKQSAPKQTAAAVASAIMNSWSADARAPDDMSVCVIRIY